MKDVIFSFNLPIRDNIQTKIQLLFYNVISSSFDHFIELSTVNILQSLGSISRVVRCLLQYRGYNI